MTLCGVVFDLDDTLYLEQDYVRSALTAVAQHIARVTTLEPQVVLDDLLTLRARGRRSHLFDAWLESRPTLPGITVAALVEIYRSHHPHISLLPGVVEMLDILRLAGLRLGLITDGPLKSQRAKVVALGLDSLLDRMVLTDEWGADFWKPNPRAFEVLERDLDCQPTELAYVADNPSKDFAAPNSRGWSTIRLRLENQLWCDADATKAGDSPQLELGSIESLSSFLLDKAHDQRAGLERRDSA